VPCKYKTLSSIPNIKKREVVREMERREEERRGGGGRRKGRENRAALPICEHGRRFFQFL
jgi:hypothetical protein